jgi:hypothetical protein
MMESFRSAVSAPSSSSYAPVSTMDGTAATGNERLVETPSSVPTASAVAMVEVVAPASLPEGYQFQAQVAGGRTVTVTVPPGGIEQGQKFSVPLGPSGPSPLASATSQGTIHIPVGHWRDGLFDCFNYGACHPHCWTSACCHLST